MNLTNIILLLVTIINVSAKGNRIKLKDVETLTLYADKWTTSRRSSPVKQLACVGGYCNGAKIQTAQCYNRGFDGNDVQWECKADMPSNYKFGRLEVSCEGYEYPEDDYILAGSCGLEYTIDEKSKNFNSNYHNDVKGYESGSSITISAIVIIGVFVAIYVCLQRNNRPEAEASSDYGGSSSWFGSRTRTSAPPPPGFRSDYFATSDGPCNASTETGTSIGPGFFSGMATGGLLGYLFGARGSNSGSRRRDYDDTSFFGTSSTSRYSSFGRSSNSGGTSSSSTTSTSTGFASTKRR